MHRSFSFRACFIIYVLALISVSLYTLFFTSLNGVHSQYRMEYLGLSAAHNFLKFWVLIHSFALFVSYCTGKKNRKQQEEKRFPETRKQVFFLVTHVCMVVAYIALLMLFLPIMRQSIAGIRAVSYTLNNLTKQAKQAINRNNYTVAIRNLEEYMRYIKDDEAVKIMLKQAYVEYSAVQRQKNTEIVADDGIVEYDGYNVGEFIQLAENNLRQEDYITAHYYASQAQRLSTEPRFDVEQLIQKALSGMMDLSKRTFAERKEWERYSRTVDGYQDYIDGTVGENTPALIRAYFTFTDLQKEYPNDPDVKLYYERTLEQMRNLSFFQEELEFARQYPLISNSVFLNRNTPDYRELVHIGAIYTIAGHHYAENIEILRFDEDGNILAHYQSKAAKISGDALNLRMIKEDRNVQALNIIYQKDLQAYFLPLAAPAEELIMSNMPYSLVHNTDTVGLLKWANNTRERAPMLWAMTVAELSERIFLSFAMFFFSLLAVILATNIRMKETKNRRTFSSIIFLPFALLCMYCIQELYLYLGRIFTGMAVLLFGNAVAVTLLLILVGILLVAVLIPFSIPSTPRRAQS